MTKKECEKRGFHRSNQFEEQWYKEMGFDLKCLDCGEILKKAKEKINE